MSAAMKLSTSLGRLRLIGFLEGASFLILLGVAMPLKYFAGQPAAVRVVGMAHGILFLLYLLAIVQAHFDHDKWPMKRSVLLVLASLLPFGPFVADRKILRGLGD
jgi:integral membrane protein